MMIPLRCPDDDESSLSHHPQPYSGNDITWGRTIRPDAERVTCSGDGEEVAHPMHCNCSGSDAILRGPITGRSDVRVADVDQWEGLCWRDDVTQTDTEINSPSGCSDSVASCTEGSKVNQCHRQEGDGIIWGGATGGCLDKPTSKVDINPVTLASDSDTPSRDLTSDPPEVISDDDAFITETPLLPLVELGLPTATTSLSRNTFECGHRQRAPDQLVQDSELQSRRPGIIEYFSRILSLYSKPLPLDVACRVWDVFFQDGEEFLFRTALGILRLYQDVLLHMDLINIAQFLSRLPDEELLSDRLFSCISALPMLSGNRK